jgi:hypothetical protein
MLMYVKLMNMCGYVNVCKTDEHVWFPGLKKLFTQTNSTPKDRNIYSY